MFFSFWRAAYFAGSVMDVEKILYSAEWAGDPAVGAAVISLLTEELTKRGVPYKLTYMKGETTGLDFTPELKAIKSESDVYRCIVVDEKILESASEALNYVFQNRGKELKEQALKVAGESGYVKTDRESEEYGRDLSETYGW